MCAVVNQERRGLLIKDRKIHLNEVLKKFFKDMNIYAYEGKENEKEETNKKY